MTISAHLSYLQKHQFCDTQILTPPAKGLGMVVVIPCHNEPHLEQSLNSLQICDLPNFPVEVIVVVNASEKDPAMIQTRNLSTFSAGLAWAKENNTPQLSFHFLNFPNLPAKDAGVGLARKIGMDEAVRRLGEAETKDGIIVCYDADSRCDSNYFVEIERHFKAHPKTPACSIYYEHPLDGNLDEMVYEGIIRYELYLRYYVQALRWAGHPHAFHTIGSSMAVRSKAYQAQGGMNRKKAGEDFYFLHKHIPLGHFSELNTTRVIPSPRESDRVPFGTGKAIGEWLGRPDPDYPVYHLDTFRDLKEFLQWVPQLYTFRPDDAADFLEHLPLSIAAYLRDINLFKHTGEIRSHTKSPEMFEKRFYRWFNGLKVLKYVHFARDHFHPNQPVGEMTRDLLNEIRPGHSLAWDLPEEELLKIYRQIDRGEF